MVVNRFKIILAILGMFLVLIHPTISQKFGSEVSMNLALLCLALLMLSLNTIYLPQLSFITVLYLLLYIMDGSEKILLLPIAAYAIFCINFEHPKIVKVVFQILLLLNLSIMVLQSFTKLEIVHYFSGYSPENVVIQFFRPVGIYHSQVLVCQILLLFVALCIIHKYADKFSALLIGAVSAITGATAGIVTTLSYAALIKPYKTMLCLSSFMVVIFLVSQFNFQSLSYNYSVIDLKKSIYSRVLLTNPIVKDNSDATITGSIDESYKQLEIINHGLLNPFVFLLIIILRGGVLAIQYTFAKTKISLIRTYHLYAGLVLVYFTQVLHYNATSLFFTIGVGMITAFETQIHNELIAKKRSGANRTVPSTHNASTC